MEIEDFLRLKKQLEDSKSSLARLQGRKETLLQQLHDRYQCRDIPGAKKLLTKKEKGLHDLERDYSAMLAEFHAKFATKLAS